MSNGWGGKRPGAGSGGKRPGAGRPRRLWDSGGPGTEWELEISRPGDIPTARRLVRVLSVDPHELVLQDARTEEIITLSMEPADDAE